MEKITESTSATHRWFVRYGSKDASIIVIAYLQMDLTIKTNLYIYLAYFYK